MKKVDPYRTKNVNVAVTNYISNVGGELVSINSFRIDRHMDKVQYVISVPIDAKFADNLQERLEMYLRFCP